MLKKINHKGMTLVEIIVVMLISSIVMMIVGSMIVSSMTSFSKTTEADKSKLAVDGISKLVRDELIYATDISNGVVSTTDGWNWFSVNKDGHLLRHDKDAKDSIDVEVFNKDYYSNKKLKFFVKTYKEKNDYKIDLKYQFSNSKDELVYGTSYTVGLINMKNGDYPLFNKATTNEIKDGTKLYYKKGNLYDGTDAPDAPDEDINKGTVADQKGCLSQYNNRGNFDTNNIYYKGDMVKFDGDWWMLVLKNGAEKEEPDSSSHVWKKISGEFDEESAYEKGDVFYIKKEDDIQYYECIKKCVNNSECPTPGDPNNNWKTYFKLMPSRPTISNQNCKVVNNYPELDKLFSFYNNIKEHEPPQYESNKKYAINSIVKVYDEEYDEWIYYVRTGQDNVKGTPGLHDEKSNEVSWTKLLMDWSAESSYTIGTTVLWHGQWIKAKTEITIVHDLDEKYGWNNNKIDEKDMYWESLGQRE